MNTYVGSFECSLCHREIITHADGWTDAGYDFAQNRIMYHNECQEITI